MNLKEPVNRHLTGGYVSMTKKFMEIRAVRDVKQILKEITPDTGGETVSLEESVGRVLYEDVISGINVPGFSKSTVDGYALLSDDTTGAGESIPAIMEYKGRIEMGQPPCSPLFHGECMYVPTGAAIPENCDAVAMVEYCEFLGDEILVQKPLAHGENIVLKGEDFREGETALCAGTVLRPQDCGVLAALGIENIQASRRPVVGIISTGNELVPVSVIPGAAQIRDINSSLCESFLIKSNCIPRKYGIVRDDRKILFETVKQASEECDAILISGGSSKDENDLTVSVIVELGEVLVHGIAIAPGKPTIIGTICGKPVIGLPGHPSSAFIILMALVDDMLWGMQGTIPMRMIKTARLSENIPSSIGREDYVRVILNEDQAIPLFGKSSLINTLKNSFGIVIVPESLEGLEEGETVEVIVW